MRALLYRPRSLLIAEFILFIFASFMHRGVLISGYEHAKAATAEATIAAVLAAGLIGCVLRPRWTLMIALAVQSLALLGTIIGAVLIVVGIGPQTAPDIALHVLMLGTLAYGSATAAWMMRQH